MKLAWFALFRTSFGCAPLPLLYVPPSNRRRWMNAYGAEPQASDSSSKRHKCVEDIDCCNDLVVALGSLGRSARCRTSV